MTLVTLRKVPGALALGLLASLVAHGALYGGEHAMGGSYHAWLLQAALAGGIAMLSGFVLLAWSGARTTLSGSVLAARLSERLPGTVPLFGATACWYVLAEIAEPHHAGVSLLSSALALTIAAWLVRGFCRWIVALLAGAVIAIFGATFLTKTTRSYTFPRPPVPRRRSVHKRRRFARPPPIEILCSA